MHRIGTTIGEKLWGGFGNLKLLPKLFYVLVGVLGDLSVEE